MKLSPEALRSLGSMEGAYTLPVVERRAPRPAVKPKPEVKAWPGWLAASIVAAVAYAIHYLPFAPFRVGERRPISAAILAIVAGALAANLLPLGAKVLEGSKHVVRRARHLRAI